MADPRIEEAESLLHTASSAVADAEALLTDVPDMERTAGDLSMAYSDIERVRRRLEGLVDA